MKIGLLPLYVRLYDEVSTEYRQRMEQFYQAVARKFLDRRIEVVTVPICTVKREFDEAVAQFETAGCDAIVTLHLAYSPSLESIEALRKTKLPIIVLDTTPTDDFSSAQSPDEIMYCHGIHGVMDMCNLLQKN